MLNKHELYGRTWRPVVYDSSNTRQLGCVFQDMEPPKSSSMLRKSSDIRKLIPMCKIHESRCTSRWHSRPKSIAWQEVCACEAAWKLAKSVLKVKEKNKATFFSLSDNWCLLAPSNLELEEREFVVDSGASMHIIWSAKRTWILLKWIPWRSRVVLR